MVKKLDMCLVELVLHPAFKSPSSNLEKILSSLSPNFFIVKGISNDFKECTNKNYKEYIIVHHPSDNGIGRIFKYLYLQIKISLKIISLRKKIHLCFFFSESGLLIPIMIAKLLRKKVVWQLPSSIKKMIQYNSEQFSMFLLIVQTLTYNLSDNLILYSPNLVKEWHLEKYKKKIFFAHEHVIDFEKFNYMKKYDKRENIIGYVGRLSNEKGILNFIKSIPAISNEKKTFNFLIIGEGELKKEIETFIKDNDLNEKVKFLNWVNHDELSWYLNQLKLIVVPSYTEGLPNIILESMASGTPVLASDVGSIPDLIINSKTGFIMNGNSPPVISESVLTALNYSNINNIIEEAESFVKSTFSAEKTAYGYKKLFESII